MTHIFLFHGSSHNLDDYELHQWKHIDSFLIVEFAKLLKGKQVSFSFCFDDAYSNIYDTVISLTALDVDTSIAVPTSRVGSRYFYNDLLERLVMSTSLSSLNLECFTLDTTSIENKIYSVKRLKSYVHNLPLHEKLPYTLDLLSKFNLDAESIVLPKSSILSYDQLSELKSEGARILHHSHFHTSFGNFSFDDVNNDLSSCVMCLQSHLSISPDVFVVPFGMPSNWNNFIPVVASRLGFNEIWMVDSPYDGWSYDMLDYSLIGRTRISVTA